MDQKAHIYTTQISLPESAPVVSESERSTGSPPGHGRSAPVQHTVGTRTDEPIARKSMKVGKSPDGLIEAHASHYDVAVGVQQVKLVDKQRKSTRFAGL
jgi:hypothetical protein